MKVLAGLRLSQRRAAATIYAQAFGHYFATSSLAQSHLPDILCDSFDLGMAIAAADPDGRLLGLVGLQFGGKHFVNITCRDLRRRFGHARGFVVWLKLAYLKRAAAPGELLLDGIAVADGARGRGVGTALLGGVERFATVKGFGSIRLDVVDTNEGARRLYERSGFVARRTVKLPAWLSKRVGFTASTTMTKIVG